MNDVFNAVKLRHKEVLRILLERIEPQGIQELLFILSRHDDDAREKVNFVIDIVYPGKEFSRITVKTGVFIIKLREKS